MLVHIGTIFQIGALPIVVLGPLGAVSLLWNAAFAKLVLGDEFTVHLVVGKHRLFEYLVYRISMVINRFDNRNGVDRRRSSFDRDLWR